MESESNQETESDKFNRVDLKVKNEKGEIIIIEVQYEQEYDFLHRILYGTSKAITEHMDKSDEYEKVVKVVSVNILYFNLGQGEDYVYHGTTHFKGIHNKDELNLSAEQQKLFQKNKPCQLSGRPAPPQYYLLKVNHFNDVAKDSLDEWIYFLKMLFLPYRLWKRKNG